jgi:hypothetical protein
MPHLNAIKARVGKIISYHAPRLNVHVDWYVVKKMPADARDAAACAYVKPLFFKEKGKWKFYKPHIRILRSSIDNHWDNPGWLDDLLVHELIHFTVEEGTRRGGNRIVHGPLFRQKMKEYGYHPDLLGVPAGKRVPSLE